MAARPQGQGAVQPQAGRAESPGGSWASPHSTRRQCSALPSPGPAGGGRGGRTMVRQAQGGLAGRTIGALAVNEPVSTQAAHASEAQKPPS